MSPKSAVPEHEPIQSAIVSACTDLGYSASEEYRGEGWRADVLVETSSKKVAFEVQLSPQSLSRTLERQEKYLRDGITGCWLFQNPVSNLTQERPDLPLFYVSATHNDSLNVSLSDRRELSLERFVKEFLADNIKFCEVARTKTEQHVKIVFYKMRCWKCEAMNHLYYVDTTFRAACNATIEPLEHLWESDKQEYRPAIIDAVREFLHTEDGQHLHLGDIKQRHSNSVSDSYISFGCYKCDSIFGDFYVREAETEAALGYGQVTAIERDIELQEYTTLPIPHWCFPDGGTFCDMSGREEVN